MTGAVREVVLVLNSGSSSLKYAAFDLASPEDGPITAGQVDPEDADDAFAAIDQALGAAESLAAVGHRIVHGGPRLLRHCIIDPAAIDELEAATPFAPLHVPPALALLRMAIGRYPGTAQIACFDTAFHAGMPDVARTLPIPRAMREAGVHRYGFHGLSCESIVHQLGDAMPARVVIAHLGHGASVTAVRNGRSIDTSMGLTPSGGVMMGTRCGDIDPGVLVHMIRTHQCDAAGIEAVIGRQSGLLGVSGFSGDMRMLHRAAPDAQADLAVRMFCRSVSKQIAGMMTALGDADLLVFTGGIGEHDDAVRAAICADLAWAGVTTEAIPPKDAQGCRTVKLGAGEEVQIARNVRAILAGEHP